MSIESKINEAIRQVLEEANSFAITSLLTAVIVFEALQSSKS